MKVEEFKEAIDSIGFYNCVNLKVGEDEIDYSIEIGPRTFATISKSITYLIDTGYAGFKDLNENLRRDLLDVIYEFTKTPIKDREDEKRYIVPLPYLVTSDGKQQFLTHKGSFFASRRDKTLRQTWKEKDLIHIPEEYRKFAVEIVEVEE